MLCSAAVWALRPGPGERPWAGSVAGVAAAWTHALGGVAAGLSAVLLQGRARAVALGGLILGVLPLAPGVAARVRDPGTFRQPAWAAAHVLPDLVDRFGLLWLLALPLAIRGARSAPAPAAGLLGLLLSLVALIGLGIAAPHQHPYLVALGAPWALLVAAGARGAGARRLLIGLAVAQGLWQGAYDLLRLRAIIDDPSPRAIDLALAEADRPWTCPPASPDPGCSGDAVILLAPPGLNDDDKRLFSPVLWRLSPLQAMPRRRTWSTAEGLLDPADHRSGHPRQVGGRVVYVFDAPRPALERALAAHARAWLVVYEQGQRPDYGAGLTRRLGAAPARVGADLLWRVEGFRPPAAAESAPGSG